MSELLETTKAPPATAATTTTTTTAATTTTSTTTTTPLPFAIDIRFKEQNTSHNATCGATATTVKGKSSCKEKLIFNEQFSNGIKPKFWTVEQLIADGPVSGKHFQLFQFNTNLNFSIYFNNLSHHPILLEIFLNNYLIMKLLKLLMFFTQFF